MRDNVLLLIVAGLLVCTTTSYADSSKTSVFQGTEDEVFNAAVLAVQSKWHIVFLDRPSKTFSFEKSAKLGADQHCGVVVKGEADGVHVTLTSNWGVGGLAPQLFKAIQDELAEHKQPH